MNILIINLTRFGDLIQTQPVISGYKKLGHRIGLVCLSNFASAATLLDGVDVVFPFPGAKLLAKLDDNWRLAIREATEFKKTVLSTFHPDRTINLTPSVASRLLTYDLAPAAGDIAGFLVDSFGFNADTSSWAAFLQMAGGHRGASPFNICDIFRRTAGLKDEGNSLQLAQPDDATIADSRALLREKSTVKREGLLALQMGASEDRRRWPVEYFVRTAEIAWRKDGLLPVLLGTTSERQLGERFAQLTDIPHINLMGQTSLTELAGVLTCCRALLTNDTGTMHLAAGLGVPLCAIFLVTAQPWDTGPYREGNICLEPDTACHPHEFGKAPSEKCTCRTSVRPEAMYGALQVLLRGEGEVRFKGTRAWRTQIGTDGFMELVSLSGHEKTDRALWITIQRAHYLPFLDGTHFTGRTGLAENLSPDWAADLSKTLTNAHDVLFLLSQQGMLLARNPCEAAKRKFLASWQNVQNILGANENLNILGLLWMFESQQGGDDLGSLLSMTERYRSLFDSLRGEFV